MIDDFLFDEPLLLLAEDGGHFDQPEKGIAYLIDGKAWVNNHAHVLRPLAGVDRRFICRVLENYDVTPWVTGTTRGKLTKAGAAAIPVPLPPLAEQRRIADVLDRADAIRAKRREAIALLDGLARAVFAEMFGSPPKSGSWPKFEMTEVVSGPWGIKAGPFGSSLKKADYSAGGYRVYGQEQVIAGRFDVGDYYIGERKFQQLRSCAVAEGDLLISLVGSFGKVLVVPFGVEPGIINPRLLKVTPNRQLVTSAFLAAFLQSPKTQGQLNEMAHGGTMGILNAGLIKRLTLSVPPIALQLEFERRLAAVDKLKAAHRASLAEMDALFASLQHRAFRGEL